MVNFAELQHQLDTNPTLAQCERQGSTHCAYGWSRTPPIGAKTAEQLAAYDKGYDSEKIRQAAQQR